MKRKAYLLIPAYGYQSKVHTLLVNAGEGIDFNLYFDFGDLDNRGCDGKEYQAFVLHRRVQTKKAE